ncbi:hypothetical protein VNO80_17002 [Phaseolus coccineus]|uniref:Uncharacterized protein n=1 Tax=Phaseolus coccineus TaxID=3886 RepID=A0AAN9R393_PHACN
MRIPFWKEGASSKSCPNPNPNSQSSYLFSSSSTSFRFIRTRFGVDCCCRVSSFTYKFGFPVVGFGDCLLCGFHGRSSGHGRIDEHGS